MDHHQVVIIGAGFAGIGLVIRLRAAGLTDLLVLERADGVGGTWRSNSYPGCACDVPSQLYSYSFAPNPDWSRAYGCRDEILDYARDVAKAHDVARDVQFGCEVLEATWDSAGQRWIITTNLGRITASVLISATGLFGEPVVPAFPGLDRFAGKTMHSFTWDHSYRLSGKRVAVIGTGASAVQMIPELAREVSELTVFQRSACWIMPRIDPPTNAFYRGLLRRIPLVGRVIRAFQYGVYETYGSFNFIDRRFVNAFEVVAKMQLRVQVRDRQLRRRLTPGYRLGCKRTAVSSNYLPTFSQPNVSLVTQAIAEITPAGIRTADGTQHDVDAIVFGTGFTLLHQLTEKIVGSHGRSVADIYRDRPQSYYGVSISGFPNLFLTSGPFGGAGNQSFLFMLESQFAYIVDALAAMRKNNWRVIDVKASAQQAFVDDAERRSADTIWLKGGCSGYYTTEDGKRNAGIWPDWSFNYRRKTKRFAAPDYDIDWREPIPAGSA